MARLRSKGVQLTFGDLLVPDRRPIHPAPPAPARPVVPEPPVGAKSKAAANLAALRLLRTLRGPATPSERTILGQWVGWGSLSGIFDEHDRSWRHERAELRALLDADGWEAARRSTLNAHYTAPVVAAALWQAVVDLGFPGGRVLEPGCGAGAFLAAAPPRMGLDWTGIEFDPSTAAICSALHPGATIVAKGFEETWLAPSTFGLAIGNVPFGAVAPHDPEHNRGRHSLHNYFILKSLALVQPGGLVAMISSRYTMDASDSKARAEMADVADFVGAVRLPAGTFRRVAGTEVVVDLIILRKREADATPRSRSWTSTSDIEVDGQAGIINSWYRDNPEYLLGRLAYAGNVNRAGITLLPRDEDLGPVLTEALASIVARSPLRWGQNAVVTPAATAVAPAPVHVPDPMAFDPTEAKEGSILINGSRFVRMIGGRAVRYEPTPLSDASELRALVGIRDTLMALLDAQARSDADEDHLGHRDDLNRQYDAYSASYGPLNRYKLVRTGRVDPESGEETHRRVRPKMGGFAADPDFYSLLALESFDPDSQTAVKAPIFTRRVVSPRRTLTSATTAQDALGICLDRTGGVDIDMIADLLATTPDDARAQLGNLVYRDPVTGLVTATEYLSGDVRTKLDCARDAAARDSRWMSNVDALEAVQPVNLTPQDIDARLGCTWIPVRDVERFAQQVLHGRAVVDHAPLTATWAVQAMAYERRSVAAISTWGTPRACAHDILEASLNQRAIQIFDRDGNGNRVLNAAATLAAREKQEELEDRFSKWVWEDAERSERLAETYNRLFNSNVLPTYDGSHLTLPGLNSSFIPHQHQRDAIWQIICEPTMLLAHAVGAGKTATMCASALEMRRLGLINKPCIVVPNHMLDQFATELLQLYPLARVLVATKAEITPAKRKEFVARCATGDWDAIVITHSAFERIPVSKKTRQHFLAGRMTALRTAADEASRAGSKGLTVKKLELACMRAEERHKALLNTRSKDDGVTFEATGIDYVFYDEAVALKNLKLESRVRGMASQGSQRAEDVSLKIGYLRARHGRRIATFATGTPITNSLAEMYVMQTYLQPERLEAAGVLSFDAWAANFGKTVSSLELAPDGGSYRLTERFARFRNIPELLSMFRAVADVRSKEDMKLPVPAVAGGEARTIVVPTTGALTAYVETLVARAKAVKAKMVDPTEDNMLVILGDGRKAALHLRLVEEEPEGDGKIGAAVSEIYKIYKSTKANVYLDSSDRESRRLGAFQLVFCDMGTPKDGEWSVYKEMRDRLVSAGIPESKVRFVHEARDDRAKAELFAACRDGRVAVLIGSTEKMGTGTNIQTRMVAIHHIDCPWRPDLLEQREGRGIRQGNQNTEIAVLRYVVEASFDVFMWGTVERKSAFIHQVMRGKATDRDVEDVGEITLDYAQVKALATGNPLIMEKAGVDNDVARLIRKRRAHEQDQIRLARALAAAKESRARLSTIVGGCEAAIARRIDTHADRFTITLEGDEYQDRKEAGANLLVILRTAIRSPTPPTITGEFAGLDLIVTRVTDKIGRLAVLRLEPSPIEITFVESELGWMEPLTLITRIERRVQDLDRVLDSASTDLERVETDLRDAEQRLGEPFDQTLLLEGLLRRQAEIDKELETTMREDAVA